MFGNREQNFEKVQYENILRECGTCEHRAILEGNKGTRTPPPAPLGDPHNSISIYSGYQAPHEVCKATRNNEGN